MSDGEGEPPKDWRQLEYEARRRAWREAYLAWLGERELPGLPVKPIWEASE